MCVFSDTKLCTQQNLANFIERIRYTRKDKKNFDKAQRIGSHYYFIMNTFRISARLLVIMPKNVFNEQIIYMQIRDNQIEWREQTNERA